PVRDRADATEIDGANRTAHVDAADRDTTPMLVFQPPVGSTHVERTIGGDEAGAIAVWAVLVNRAGPGAARPLGHELEASRQIRTDRGRARDHEACGLVVIVQARVRAGVITVVPVQDRPAHLTGN